MKPGRKSAEDIATNVVAVEFGKRPEPLPDLNERQAEIWRATVASEPADYFGTGALRNMLGDYCRHREAAEKLSGIIDKFQAEWLKSAEGAKRFRELLKMRESETRAAASMATKLRLTNQSRYTPQAAATASRNTSKIQKPWEL